MEDGQLGSHGAPAHAAVAEGHNSGPEHAATLLQEMEAITAEVQTLKEEAAAQIDVLSMVGGQDGDGGAPVPEVVEEEHSDESEHVPTPLQEMVDPHAQEGTS